MKATIKLTEITKLNLTTDLAHLDLTLENEAISTKTTFSMKSNGMGLRVASEHSVGEIKILCEWLNTPSKNDNNLRDNDSEVRMFAKEMIKTNKKLNQSLSI